MGNELTTNNGKVDGNVATERTAGGERTSGTSASSARPSDRGRGVGTPTPGANKRTDGNENEKVVPVVVTVDETDEQRKKDERNARRRARYAEQKADQKGEPKNAAPKQGGQKKKPKKVNNHIKQSFSTEQINALLVSLSAIVASRPGCEHWLLSESEVQTITTPLMSMLAESDKLSKISEHSNQIALAIACVTIFAPRVVVTVQQMKMKKDAEKHVRNKIDEAKGNTETVSGRDDKRHANDDKNNRANVPFYGIPIN